MKWIDAFTYMSDLEYTGDANAILDFGVHTYPTIEILATDCVEAALLVAHKPELIGAADNSPDEVLSEGEQTGDPTTPQKAGYSAGPPIVGGHFSDNFRRDVGTWLLGNSASDSDRLKAALGTYDLTGSVVEVDAVCRTAEISFSGYNPITLGSALGANGVARSVLNSLSRVTGIGGRGRSIFWLDRNGEVLVVKLRRLLGGSMLMISLVVSLAACDLSSTPPTDQDIVGGWVHDGPGDEDSTLVMSADGSFSLDHVPRSVVSPVSGPGSPIDWSDVLDVTGTWSIGDYGNNSPFLNFDIDPSDGYGGFGTDMGVRGSGNSRQLFLQVGPGDDDRQFEFSRKTSQ